MQIDFCSGLGLVESAGRNIGEIDAQVDWQTLVFGGNLATDVEDATDNAKDTIYDACYGTFVDIGRRG